MCGIKVERGRVSVLVVNRIANRYAMFDAFDSRSGFRTWQRISPVLHIG